MLLLNFNYQYFNLALNENKKIKNMFLLVNKNINFKFFINFFICIPKLIFNEHVITRISNKILNF